MSLSVLVLTFHLSRLLAVEHHTCSKNRLCEPYPVNDSCNGFLVVDDGVLGSYSFVHLLDSLQARHMTDYI